MREHSYNKDKVCCYCGCSQGAIKHFGWMCGATRGMRLNGQGKIEILIKGKVHVCTFRATDTLSFMQVMVKLAEEIY